MQHIFITDGTIKSARWSQAFAGANVVDISRDQLNPEPNCCYWLLTKVDDWQQVLKRLQVGGAKVLILTLSESRAEAISALGLGASGYLHALADTGLFQQVFDTVSSGGLWVGADLLRQVLLQTLVNAQALTESVKSTSADLSLLTAREQEVARAVAAGANNREVSEQLGIRERTVKAHLGRCFEKLQVRDRVQLSLLVNR